MTSWNAGVLVGLLLGLAVAAVSGGAGVDAYLRAAPDAAVLDLRVDPSALSRAVNPPSGLVGQVEIRRRSWAVASVYTVTLRLRAGAVPEGVRVLVRLPGRVVAADGAVVGGAVTWEDLTGPRRARAVSVHGLRVAVLAAAVAAALAWGRRAVPRRS